MIAASEVLLRIRSFERRSERSAVVAIEHSLAALRPSYPAKPSSRA
jgi:hypothetical protein